MFTVAAEGDVHTLGGEFLADRVAVALLPPRVEGRGGHHAGRHPGHPAEPVADTGGAVLRSDICPISWAAVVEVAVVELSHGQSPGAGRDGGGGMVAVTPPTVWTANSHIA